MLSSAYIYEQIPIEIRPFFKIGMAEIPKEHIGLLDNIASAVKTISQFAHLNKTVTMLIGSSPFELSIPSLRLSAQILEPALHVTLEGFVFLDLNSLLKVSPPLQRACVLEELAHSLMNVKDEHLVSVMVAEMLPDVRYQNGRYVTI